jgi:hypothetical protein
MKKTILFILVISSNAYAHLLPLKDEGMIVVSAGDYDTAFKMQDACSYAGVENESCRKLLGYGNALRTAAARDCIIAQYVPISLSMKKRLNEQKARGHSEILEDAALGKHFYTANDIVFHEAERALDAKDRGKGSEALQNPLLGGQVLNAICSERSKYCVTEGSQTLLSPIYKKSKNDLKVGPVVGAKGEFIARQIQKPDLVAQYRERLEVCIAGRMKDAKSK